MNPAFIDYVIIYIYIYISLMRFIALTFQVNLIIKYIIISQFINLHAQYKPARRELQKISPRAFGPRVIFFKAPSLQVYILQIDL